MQRDCIGVRIIDLERANTVCVPLVRNRSNALPAIPVRVRQSRTELVDFALQHRVFAGQHTDFAYESRCMRRCNNETALHDNVPRRHQHRLIASLRRLPALNPADDSDLRVIVQNFFAAHRRKGALRRR
jgi:hypothetical protein